MITASHNPPNYNGYKVFQADGSQITSPKDIQITEEISKITDYSKIQVGDWQTLLKEQKIRFIGEEVLQNYYALAEESSLNDKEQNHDFGVVYTPLHGAGSIPMQEVMKKRNFQNFLIVAQQKEPDPDFSTLKSPNPEDISAMQLAIQTARKNDQLILATDPDADRLGVMARRQEQWVFINGNQIGALLLYYKLASLKKVGALPKKGVFITTIVTSQLLEKIARSFGVQVYETLTGFKNIAEVMGLVEKTDQKFLFACEESNGYLVTEKVRDKDGIIAAVLFAEMAACQKDKGVMGLLAEIYENYGAHYDSLIALTLEGKNGRAKIQKIMSALRENIRSIFPEEEIIQTKDYQDPDVVDAMKKRNLAFSASNVFSCYLIGGSRITARPSGTEPKIKFYINLAGDAAPALQQKESRIKQAIKYFVDNL
jgi:phosphomannomutase